MSTTLIYIVPYRGKDVYRQHHLQLLIQWLSALKKALFEQDIEMKCAVIEENPTSTIPATSATLLDYYTLIPYSGPFNKCWALNIAVKQHPDFDYYAFGDADIIAEKTPDFVYTLKRQILAHSQFFQPFDSIRMIPMEKAYAMSSLPKNVVDWNQWGDTHSLASICAPLCGGCFVTTLQVIQTIEGFDEGFEEWGCEDDSSSKRIELLCDATVLTRLPGTCLHLGHLHDNSPERLAKSDKNRVRYAIHYANATPETLRAYIESSSNWHNCGNPAKYSQKPCLPPHVP
jgi:hypothetical protein